MPSQSAQHFPEYPIPEPLRGEEPGSFAQSTVAVRLPDIGRRTLAENDFPPEVAGRLQALIDDLPEGRVRHLQDRDAPDWKAWETYCSPHLGQTWLQVPWFFAETYFYRRLLEATGYFTSGPGEGRDPFLYQKRLGLESSEEIIDRLSADLEARKEELAALTSEERIAPLQDLFTMNLWGNQADLSIWPVGSPSQPRDAKDAPNPASSRLVVDDSAAIAAHLLQPLQKPQGRRAEASRIDFLLDNAGLELVNDLLLADALLGSGLAREVRLHAKVHPTFVSDAMPSDVLSTFDFLLRRAAPASRRLGMRLYHWLQEGRLRLRSDLYWNSPLPGWQLPPDLRDELAGSDLIISKGDANYRRLLGDRHWPLETPLAGIVAYLPAPLAVLRVCKSELAVGLEEGQAAQLTAEDPQWMVNGNWGMIQFATRNM